MILADLGNPHPTYLADVLDVDVRTVRRWLKAGRAPRAATLALFWMTSYGFDHIDVDLSNRLRLWGSMVDSYSRELRQTRDELAALRARLSTTPGRPLTFFQRRFSSQATQPQGLSTLPISRHPVGLSVAA